MSRIKAHFVNKSCKFLPAFILPLLKPCSRVNAVGALQLLSDLESLKSVRDPLLKARFCCSFASSFLELNLIFLQVFQSSKKGSLLYIRSQRAYDSLCHSCVFDPCVLFLLFRFGALFNEAPEYPVKI